MKRHSYREQDIAFGQIMLTLRTALKLTQTGLANIVGVSRISIADWEAGNKYPKPDNLRKLITYAVEHRAFPVGQEATEIRVLWKAAHQKIPLDERWLAGLLSEPGVFPPLPFDAQVSRPVQRSSPPSGALTQPPPLIGREADLREIARILSSTSCRLLTLIGPGGVGKTSLALAVAAEQGRYFQDGVAFVSLEAVSTPSQIISAIVTALDRSVARQVDSEAALMAHLRDQNVLLILDNFEQVLESRGLVYELLRQAPNITILVTSQARLNLRAEWLFDVVGLAYPVEASGTDATSPQDALNNPAVQLFIQRARQIQPHFEPSDAVLASITRICQQVSGIPLAIELAAAGIRTLPTTEIEQQIRKNFDLLSISYQDIPARHRSLRAIFDYSWAMLDPAEQTLVSRIAVFRGGCTPEAAQTVTGATFAALWSLVDRSLLHHSRAADEASGQRFFLLEPTREYALEKLVASAEADRLRQAHAIYYLGLAEAATAELEAGEPDAALRQLDQEQVNLRAALLWARDSGSATLGLQLAGALWRVWRKGGFINEARLWLDELLALDDANTETPALRARLRALTGAAWLATDQGDFDQAVRLFEQTRALRSTLGESEDETILLINAALHARATGDYQRATDLLEDTVTRQRALLASASPIGGNIAPALYCLALVVREHGDFARAEALFKEGIDNYRRTGDREGVAQGELGLSDIARDQGEIARLRAYAEPSLATHREFGIEWAIGFALNNLAQAAYAEGDQSTAFAYSSETVTLFRGLQNLGSLAEGLITLGKIHAAQGETTAAREALLESLRIGWTVGPRLIVACALEGLASVAMQQGKAAEAVQMVGMATALRVQMKTPLRPVDQPVLDWTLTTARETLGEAAFAAVWAEYRGEQSASSGGMPALNDSQKAVLLALGAHDTPRDR